MSKRKQNSEHEPTTRKRRKTSSLAEGSDEDKENRIPCLTRRQRKTECERRRRSNETDFQKAQRRRNDREAKAQKNAKAATSKWQQNINNQAWLIQEYKRRIAQGPTCICSCCGRLWFKKSMTEVNNEMLDKWEISDSIRPDAMQKSQYDEDKAKWMHRLCGTCLPEIKHNKRPRLSLSNGFTFPAIPEVLKNLTSLEERLVALRLPFMQIRKLGRDRQYGLVRNIANVPNNFDVSVKSLPRKISETETVQVMLMRKMEYNSPYMHENVRPNVVQAAAEYLISKPLYRHDQVVLRTDWQEPENAPTTEFSNHANNEEECENPDGYEGDEYLYSSDESENEEESPNLNEVETLIIENDETLIRMAPGEGSRPMSLLQDIDCEIKAWPTIYCGEYRHFNKDAKIAYPDIAKSESMMFDRRAVHPTKLLYTCKKLQAHQVSHEVSICMRKKKAGGTEYTAGDVRIPRTLNSIIDHDEGYRCLKDIRGSPAYLQGQQKKVLAMIRQFGLPTFFFTCSAAETKWDDLLITLHQVLKGSKISKETASELTWEEKAELIRNDPITCARYFEHRFRTLLNYLFNKPAGVFAPKTLTDYYQRVEFQQRGSPHSHGLYWIKDAPVFDPNDPTSANACEKFIDTYITCKRQPEFNELGEVNPLYKAFQYQLHKHGHVCKSKSGKGKKKCRFGYPIPPLPVTKILMPLPPDCLKDEINLAKNDLKHIKSKLEEIGRNYTDDFSVTEFLSHLQMTSERYENAIRSGIKRPTVFLRRGMNAIYVNAYNATILQYWDANIDIQFILDPYACAAYCANYINKISAGVSKALKAVRSEIQNGNFELAQTLSKYGNAFLNSTEISAQEAAYIVVGLPLTTCSREEVYINTSPPNERVFFLRPQADLEKLPPDSTNIGLPGLLDHYVRRSPELETVCLACFAADYNYARGNQKREKSRIIRYRRYNIRSESVLYQREQLMLYVPWRDESWLDENTETKFQDNFEEMVNIRKKFEHSTITADIEELRHEPDGDEEDLPDPKSCGLLIEDVEMDDITVVKQNQNKTPRGVEYITPINQIPEERYLDMVRSLNSKQWKYFLHLVHNFKVGNLPFHEFVSGGAGVGKSHLITTIVQTMIRHFSKSIDNHPDDIFVLVCAPTGKAAYNVHGITLHSAFQINPKDRDLSRLKDDPCNTLRQRLSKLQLIIIDEISMVSLKCFFHVDQRLKQIFQNNEMFGNIPLLVVGDFRQIRPVFGQFTFEIPMNSFSNPLWESICMHELTEPMRQQGDIPFINALNHMGDGEMTQEDIELMNSRTVYPESLIPNDAIRLFKTNKECEAYNIQAQNAIPGAFACFEAIDFAEGIMSKNESVLQSLRQLNHTHTDGLPSLLNLKIGAIYMVSVNVDVTDGLFNGASGKLMYIEDGFINKKKAPVRIYLEFKDKFTGVSARRKHQKRMKTKNIQENLTPIQLMTRPISKYTSPGGRITRTQFPVISANAITICKAQGSSFESVSLSLQLHLNRDLLYVGCSRCYTIDGLFLEGTFTPPPKLEAKIQNAINDLRNKPIQFSFKFLDEVPDSYYKLIFHNVQSIRKNHANIAAEVSFMASDIISLVEPHTYPNEAYQLNGFQCVQKINCEKSRSSLGSMIFVKNNVSYSNVDFSSTNSGNKEHIDLSQIRVGDINIVTIYRSPKSSVTDFTDSLGTLLQKLAGTKILLVGDVNIRMSYKNKPRKHFRRLMKLHSLHNNLSRKVPTTNQNTTIDVCFSNFEVDAWVYESIFSDHKPICVAWKK